MQPLRTYLRYEKDAKAVRRGAKLEVSIPLYEAKISKKTLRSLDGDIEEFLMNRFGSLQILLLNGHKTIAEGEVTGASTDGRRIRLNYQITEVYRK
ncbi:MAG: hypothetical protein QXM31_00780 [Candidatus Woesearchaeota archaeon]